MLGVGVLWQWAVDYTFTYIDYEIVNYHIDCSNGTDSSGNVNITCVDMSMFIICMYGFDTTLSVDEHFDNHIILKCTYNNMSTMNHYNEFTSESDLGYMYSRVITGQEIDGQCI